MDKMISAKTTDFQPDEESGIPKVYDGQKVIIGGMITERTIKYTRNNKVMAFLTVEDLVGAVEVVVFPRLSVVAHRNISKNIHVLRYFRFCISDFFFLQLIKKKCQCAVLTVHTNSVIVGIFFRLDNFCLYVKAGYYRLSVLTNYCSLK